MNTAANFDTQALREKDNIFIHPWDDLAVLGSYQRTIMTRGKGIYLTDSDGHEVIDGPGGMWCVNIGHGREEIAQAVAKQILSLGYFSPWAVGSAPSSILAERLAALAPGDLNHVFFTTCGSTAVDSALRFVFFYNNVLGRPEKKHIISRIGSYHGSTHLSATCSGKLLEKKNMDMMDGIIHHLPTPKPLLRPEGMTLEAFSDAKVKDLEDKILELGPDRVAAFIAEPILASGGVIVPPPGYHQRCLEICRRYDVLYISDEVVTAFGRLGHYFASESVFGIVPDIITMAKGLTSGYVPMGGMVISDRLIQDLRKNCEDARYFFNGFTYSGHPVCAAAALANLDVIEHEGLLAHVRSIGPYFAECLRSLEDLPVVAEVRAMGLMAGVECTLNSDEPDEDRDYAFALRVDRHCQELGLLVRPIYNMCVMSPPLVITRTQIDDLVRILRAGIELAMAEVLAAP